MERYPVLALILRFGTIGAATLALVGGLLVTALAWTAFGWIAIPLALFIAALVFVIAKSYVEIVTIITEMLVPR